MAVAVHQALVDQGVEHLVDVAGAEVWAWAVAGLGDDFRDGELLVAVGEAGDGAEEVALPVGGPEPAAGEEIDVPKVLPVRGLYTSTAGIALRTKSLLLRLRSYLRAGVLTISSSSPAARPLAISSGVASW